MAHLYIIRGLPGSGKTTFAKKLYEAQVVESYVEADMWFTSSDGSYNFAQNQLKYAHNWCQEFTFRALRMGDSIAVSNTFSRIWEMQPYIDYCKENGHTFTVITCEGNYGNIHDVPPEAIERMKQRWEKYE